MSKKIMFLTGTRADFGHQKSLIDRCIKERYEVFVFITGMHLDNKYGLTINEIYKCNYDKIYAAYNHKDCNRGSDTMDEMLASTIFNFSSYVKEVSPDLIVIFADRFEALAGAIVGALNNILTIHIQAGDVSGTIDNSIRHAISKLCHAHFCANKEAKNRLINMGEVEENIFIIGTPGLDVLFFKNLPLIEESKKKYNIDFGDYSIFIFHPVTTEIDDIDRQINEVINSITESNLNYIVICPNNDMGSDKIFKKYKDIKSKNIKVFSSIDHFDFLILLKNADFIIGNSSCGIIEAPCYGIPTINIGTRQQGRTSNIKIINCKCDRDEILDAIGHVNETMFYFDYSFGNGCASDKFIEILRKDSFWKIKKQKNLNYDVCKTIKN